MMQLPAENSASAAHDPTQTLLGVFGGTFDPVHYGHLRLAEEAREALDLRSVLWIPAGQPPLRQAPAATAAQRLAMLRLALAGNAAFELDDTEAREPAPSYSITTLERLRLAQGAEQPLVLLLGVDAFLGLPNWHRWRELLTFAHIAVATRPGYALDVCNSHQLAEPLASELHARLRQRTDDLKTAAAGYIVSFEMTPLAISATLIRERLSRGASVRYLLPDTVLDYIALNSLYRSAPHGY